MCTWQYFLFLITLLLKGKFAFKVRIISSDVPSPRLRRISGFWSLIHVFPFVLFCLDRKTLCQFPKRVDFLCVEWDSGVCNTIMYVYVVYGFFSSNLKYCCRHLSVIKTVVKMKRKINDNYLNHYQLITSIGRVFLLDFFTYLYLLLYFYLHLIIYWQLY